MQVCVITIWGREIEYDFGSESHVFTGCGPFVPAGVRLHDIFAVELRPYSGESSEPGQSGHLPLKTTGRVICSDPKSQKIQPLGYNAAIKFLLQLAFSEAESR